MRFSMHMKCTGRGRRRVIKPQSGNWLHGGTGTKITGSYKTTNGFSKSQRQLNEIWGLKTWIKIPENGINFNVLSQVHIYPETHSVTYLSVNFLCCIEKTSLADSVKN